MTTLAGTPLTPPVTEGSVGHPADEQAWVPSRQRRCGSSSRSAFEPGELDAYAEVFFDQPPRRIPDDEPVFKP